MDISGPSFLCSCIGMKAYMFPELWSSSVTGILDLLSGRSSGERIQMQKQYIAKGLECHPMESIELIAQAMGNNGRIPD